MPTARRCRRLAWIAAGSYVLFCLGCAAFQRKLLYFPERIPGGTLNQMAQRAGVQRWRDASGKPIGWKVPAASRDIRGSVLVTHGNAGCAIERTGYAALLQSAAPFDVFVLEYPGYGDRSGKPGQASFCAAAEQAFQTLDTNAPVYLLGESIGTGVACWLAGQHPDRVAGVVLLAPYNSLVDVAQSHAPLLPVRLLLVDRFPAEDYLRSFHGPLAVLVSDRDEVVPAKFGRKLYKGYAGPKRLWQFTDDTHETLMDQSPVVWREVVDFWEESQASADKHPQ